MSKQQTEDERQKKMKENRKESADAARKQLGIPKKKSRESGK